MLASIVVAALAQSLTVSAATMMVTVAANNKFTFTPNTVTAQPGDMVAFNFVAQNHSIASSKANTPCQPEKNAIFSDFQPIPGPMNGKPNNKATNTPMFMVPITDTDPIYIYCTQAQHCQAGMVMVINPPDDNAVTKYAQKAAQAQKNVSPRGGMSGGSIQNNAAGTTPKSVLGGTAGDAAPPKNAKANNGGKGNNNKAKGNN